MGLRTLAAGPVPRGQGVLYKAPTGRWVTVSSIVVVSKSQSIVTLDLTHKTAASNNQLTPSGFYLNAGYKCEDDQPHGLAPGDSICSKASLSGLSFVITGEERNAA